MNTAGLVADNHVVNETCCSACVHSRFGVNSLSG